MSSWQRNEVRQAIENTLRSHVTDAEAHAIAELVMGAFVDFRDGYDLIDVTKLGSVDEEAVKQRYIDARIYYGNVEHLRRPRPTRQPDWTSVDTDPQRHPRDDPRGVLMQAYERDAAAVEAAGRGKEER